MKLLNANLPDKLSDVIMIALEDLRKVERSKKYKIDMGLWHEPNGACSVCFAGALISQTEGATPDKYIEPDNFEDEDERKFYALDHLRSYDFEEMFETITGSWDLSDEQKSILNILEGHFEIKEDEGNWGLDYKQTDHLPLYKHDNRGFKQNMETVAAILQEHGL